jgi:His/Glu/Gln/Arg/opine family amino acid ABC transporter permease subunit
MHPVEVFLTKGGTYLAWIIQGLPETIKVAIGALIFALIFGLIVALIRMARWRLLRIPAIVYVEIFRGTPAFVQLFVIYFGLPDLGYQPSPFQAGIVGLGLNGAAYLSEIYRAGIESIQGANGSGIDIGDDPGARHAIHHFAASASEHAAADHELRHRLVEGYGARLHRGHCRDSGIFAAACDGDAAERRRLSHGWIHLPLHDDTYGTPCGPARARQAGVAMTQAEPR